MPHREERTLRAINDLKKDYPYAAGLLTYCLIERELKYFILSQRHQPAHKLNMNSKRAKKIPSYEQKSDDVFIKEFLSNLTLDHIKYIVTIFPIRPIARRRNNHMHSNDLIGSRVIPNDEKRQEKHRKDLERAIKDLKSVFNTISDEYKIIEDDNGVLRYVLNPETNPTPTQESPRSSTQGYSLLFSKF